MDPNANLEELRGLYRTILDNGQDTFDDATRLAELVEALDGWLSKGGFLPSEWAKGRAS